ncbi:hypothetical protein EPUS_00770 [Endocarpon pusillum Z07020]|uniref:Uncharacterized protein n=1 Tax=Endocarpon pusillum (strain Z07020 / HMAS-L-300199) TaxID=1263415 RepID=U1HVE1_ENDPU|nr:uncharacterized protein EPUS_00770 [Endocarpon pusillum Z07020]ERF74640.1 hypothetical protein EPUS_00770 [Endocarpon pusillum Z07020]
MTTVHSHPALQAVAVEHGHENPSLSTLTNPGMLLRYRDTPSSPYRFGESSFQSSDTEPSPSSSTGFASPASTEAFEIGTARTFLMPIRPKPAPPSSNPLLFKGYSHSAPLSDIGEEESTPKSKRLRSRSPSPTASSPAIAPQLPGSWGQKREKRLSLMSSSSSMSIGSDLQWEAFDTRAGMSDRLRADLAAAGDDSFNLDGFDNKRDSMATNGDDEYSSQALSKKAEQILASAKKRLTNMEGNLSKARTSLLETPKGSPSASDYKQAGGLYRSISQGGDRRLSQSSNVRKARQSHTITNGAGSLHVRNLSDTSVLSGAAKYPRPPEVRSASAMDYGYGSHSIDSMLYDRSKSATPGLSPTLSRIQLSPLTTLQEEEGNPPTGITSSNPSQSRGLGIRNHKFHSCNTSHESSFGFTRSQSQRSTRELWDQVNGLRSKIADLCTGQQAERYRRNSLQNLRTPSSVAAAEEWYLGAAEYKAGESPLSTSAGMGWRSGKDREEGSTKSPTFSQSPQSPQTPRSPRRSQSPCSAKDSGFEEVQRGPSPVAHSGRDFHSHSNSLNSPSALRGINGDGDDQDSYIQESQYEDAFGGGSEEIGDVVAASEEEQIYLNEVLEESLQDVEPAVPPIPDVIHVAEPERHEDRADAFDYENFFLHSALGNYSQTGYHRRNLSQATAESRASYQSTESVETTRGPQARENEPISEEDAERLKGDGREVRDAETSWQDEPPNQTAPNPPFAQQHLRTHSIESVSTTATFATATEGGGDDSESETDTVPSEILHWGERPLPSTNNMVGAWPSPPASSPRGLANLPNGHASPLGIHVIQAESDDLTAPSSDALPTPPTSSPLHQETAQEEQEDEESDHEAGEDDDHSSQQQPPNTEILVSALITLANPDFKPTRSFSELDKELVISVLRSVGGVCEGIDASDSRGEVQETRVWRRRLDTARRLLEGEIEIEDD